MANGVLVPVRGPLVAINVYCPTVPASVNPGKLAMPLLLTGASTLLRLGRTVPPRKCGSGVNVMVLLVGTILPAESSMLTTTMGTIPWPDWVSEGGPEKKSWVGSPGAIANGWLVASSKVVPTAVAVSVYPLFAMAVAVTPVNVATPESVLTMTGDWPLVCANSPVFGDRPRLIWMVPVGTILRPLSTTATLTVGEKGSPERRSVGCCTKTS